MLDDFGVEYDMFVVCVVLDDVYYLPCLRVETIPGVNVDRCF